MSYFVINFQKDSPKASDLLIFQYLYIDTHVHMKYVCKGK